MSNLEVAVLSRREMSRKSKLRPHHLMKYVATYPITRIDVLTECILRAQVKQESFQPKWMEVAKPKTWKEVNSRIALVSVNDPIALYQMMEHMSIVAKYFDALIIGGQLVSLVPNLVRKYFPEANLFIGESEGQLGTIIRRTMDGTRGETFVANPPNIAVNYAIPDRDPNVNWWIHSMELGRGCKYGCDFCGITRNMRRIRIRDPDQVIEELDMLRKTTPRVLFVDPNLSIYPPEYLDRIFSFIEKKGMRWLGEGSSKELSEQPEIWDLMSRTCIAMLQGIEDTHLAELRGNKTSNSLVEPKNGTIILNTAIFGHPGQTPEDAENLIRLFTENRLTGSFHMFAPYPGTKAFADAFVNGRITEKDLIRYDRRFPVMRNDTMSPEEMIQLFVRINKEAHPLSASISELIRVVRESPSLQLKLERAAGLIVLRVLASLVIGKKKLIHDYNAVQSEPRVPITEDIL
jgi:hypothetical protein